MSDREMGSNKTPNDPVKEQISQDKFGKSYDELTGARGQAAQHWGGMHPAVCSTYEAHSTLLHMCAQVCSSTAIAFSCRPRAGGQCKCMQRMKIGRTRAVTKHGDGYHNRHLH